MDAGQYLDEGGFSGAVFAKKRVDFAGMQIEIDVTQNFDSAELLGDTARFDEHRRNIVHASAVSTLPGVAVSGSADPSDFRSSRTRRLEAEKCGKAA
jgi:hypothetical protein